MTIYLFSVISAILPDEGVLCDWKPGTVVKSENPPIHKHTTSDEFVQKG